MRPIIAFLVAALCLGTTASAQTEIANLLAAAKQDPKAAEAAVSAALRSNDPNVRAIAARIANARRMTNLVPAFNAMLDRDSDANAVREEIRTVVMLGGVRMIDRAFYASDRFGKRLDVDVANAAAHLGPDAINSFFTSMADRNVDRDDFFRVALWGHPESVSPLAARLLKDDARGFRVLLLLLGFEPRMILSADVVGSALNSSDREVRSATMWFLFNQALKARFEPQWNEMIGGLRVPRDDADQIAGVELLRRAAGFPRRNFPEFGYALADELVQFRLLLAPAKALTLLDDRERRIATEIFGETDDRASTDLPPFVVPGGVPQGLTAETMRMNGCNQGWFGTAKVALDEHGFVASRDLTAVETSDGCRKALDTVLEYSIVDNRLITAGRQNDAASLVRAPNGPMCFDEGSVPSIVAMRGYGLRAFRLPRIKERIAPVWPAGVAKKTIDVEVETLVTATGCVRAARVTGPSPNAAINRAALVAAQQWTFQPATIDTNPVEMLSSVTIEFR